MKSRYFPITPALTQRKLNVIHISASIFWRSCSPLPYKGKGGKLSTLFKKPEILIK